VTDAHAAGLDRPNTARGYEPNDLHHQYRSAKYRAGLKSE
jgi:hypothetical protein